MLPMSCGEPSFWCHFLELRKETSVGRQRTGPQATSSHTLVWQSTKMSKYKFCTCWAVHARQTTAIGMILPGSHQFTSIFFLLFPLTFQVACTAEKLRFHDPSRLGSRRHAIPFRNWNQSQKPCFCILLVQKVIAGMGRKHDHYFLNTTYFEYSNILIARST